MAHGNNQAMDANALSFIERLAESPKNSGEAESWYCVVVSVYHFRMQLNFVLIMHRHAHSQRAIKANMLLTYFAWL